MCLREKRYNNIDSQDAEEDEQSSKSSGRHSQVTFPADSRPCSLEKPMKCKCKECKKQLITSKDRDEVEATNIHWPLFLCRRLLRLKESESECRVPSGFAYLYSVLVAG